jgi:hypothetical protein
VHLGRATAAILATGLSAGARAELKVGPDRLADMPVVAPAVAGGAGGAVAFGAGEYLYVYRGFTSVANATQTVRGVRLTPAGALLDDPPLMIGAIGGPPDSGGYFQVAVAFDGTDFVVAYGGGAGVNTRFVDPSGTVGPEQVLDQQMQAVTNYAQVAAGGGHALVTWTDFRMRTGGGNAIRGAILDGASGAITVPDFEIGSVNAGPGSIWVDRAAVAWADSSSPGFLVAWDMPTYHASANIWASRVAVDGTLAPPFEVNSDASVSSMATGVTVASNGSEFMLGWQEPDVHARVVPFTGAPGTEVTLGQAYATGAVQTTAVAGAFFMIWEQLDPASTSNTALGIAGARVSFAGVALDPAGVLLAPYPANGGNLASGASALASDGTKAMAAFTLNHELVESDTYALLPDPAMLQATAPSLISRGSNIEYARSVASDGKIFLLTWTDDRNVESQGLDIYGIRLDASGAPIDSAPFVICGAPGDQIQPTAAAAAGGDFLVVWADARTIAYNAPFPNLYGSRVPASGPPLDGNGILIHPDTVTSNRIMPVVAASPGGWMVAWDDRRTNFAAVWATTVGTDGSVSAVDRQIAGGSDSAHAACEASVVWDGQRWFVAYAQPCPVLGGLQSNVLGRFLDASGKPAVGAVQVAATAESESSPALASDGTLIYAAWSTGSQILAATLADGDSAPGDPVAIAGSPGSIREVPSIALAGSPASGVVITWIDHSPVGARAQRTDAGLQPIGKSFALSASPTALGEVTTPGSGWLLPGTLPAPVAVTAGGDAVAAYSNDRVHYRSFGLGLRGAGCASAGDCADGICAHGVCCDTPCDGLCQACTQAGCVATPATDARCAPPSCAVLSTDCRSYSDPPAGRCEAFGRCAMPGGLDECVSASLAPDGTVCSSAVLAGASGTCLAGDCVVDGGAPIPAERMPPGCTCALGGGDASGAWLAMACLLAALLRRRRVLALLLALAARPALAEFRPGADRAVDAPTVGFALGDQTQPAIAFGAGEYLAVYIDSVDAPLDDRVRGVRLRPDGTLIDVLPLELGDLGPSSGSVAVAFTGSTFVVASISQRGLYVNTVDPGGTVGTEQMLSPNPSISDPVAAAGGGGQALVVWNQPVPMNVVITGARLDATGHFSSPTIALSTPLAQNFPEWPSVAWGGAAAGNFLVTWSLSTGNGAQVWAARVDTQGKVEAPWRVNDGTLDPYFGVWARAACNGSEYLVAWQDTRDQYAGTAQWDEIFARVIPFSGAPAAADFLLATGGANAALEWPVATAVGSTFLVDWVHANDPIGANLQTTGAGRVSAAGMPLDGTSGVGYPGEPYYLNNTTGGGLASDGTDAMLAVSTFGGGITGSDVYAVLADPAQIPQAAGSPVSVGPNLELVGSLVSDGEIFLLVFSDDRGNGGQDIYALRFDGAGQPLDPRPFVVCNAPGDQFLPAAAARGHGDFLIAWSDRRDALGAFPEIYATRLAASGAPLDGNGVLVHPGAVAGGRTAVAIAGGASGWLLAWEDWRNDAWSSVPMSEIWSATVAPDGTVGANEQQIVTVTDPSRQACAPAAAWNGQRWFVAYEKPCAAGQMAPLPSGDLYGRWVDASGQPSAGIVTVAAEPLDSEQAPRFAFDGSALFVVWSAGAQILAARLSDLAPATDQAVAIAASLGTVRESPSIAFLDGPSRFLVSWIDHTPVGARAQLVDGSLQPIGASFPLSASPTLGGSPVLQPYFYFHGMTRATPAAPVVAVASGGALAAYDLVENIGGAPLPRAHFRAFGLKPRGASCGAAGDCADGFCAAGVCCDQACDGPCQACTADGCVATPASDSRCAPATCAALSTDCRTYANPSAGACAAFNRCAAANPGDCRDFTDLPDGTACSAASLAGAPGVCSAGACVIAGEGGQMTPRQPSSGCSMSGAGARTSALGLALLALLACARRRRILLALLALTASARAELQLGDDRPLDAPVLAPELGGQGDGHIAFGAGQYLVTFIDGTLLRALRLQPDGTVLDDPALVVHDFGDNAATVSAVAFDGTRFVLFYLDPTGLVASTVDANGIVGPQLPIAAGVVDLDAPVAAGGDGHLLVAWTALDTTNNYSAIHGALLDGSGKITQPEFVIAPSILASGWRNAIRPTVAWGGAAAGTFLAAWQDGGAWTKIFAAHVDTQATVEAAWQVNAVATTPPRYSTFWPAAASNGSEFIVLWSDARVTTSPLNLYGRLVPFAGAPAAADFPVALAPSTGALTTPLVVGAGSGFVAAWVASISTSSGIQVVPAAEGGRLDGSGALLDGTGGVTLAAGSWGTTVSGLASDGTHAMAALERGDYIIEGGDVYAMALDPTQPLAAGADTLVTRGRNLEYMRSLATDGDVFLAVWADDRDGLSGLDVLGLRLDRTGAPLDPQPFVICQADRHQFLPVAAAAPGGEFLVVWTDDRASATELYGARVHASGAPLDGSPFRIHTSSPATAAAVAASPGGWLVAWEDWRLGYEPDHEEVWSTLVGLDGSIAGESRVTIGSDENHQSCAPSAAWTGQHFFVAYEQPCTLGFMPASGNVLGRWLDTSGRVLTNSPVPLGTSSVDSERAPALTSDGASSLFAAWSTGAEIRVARLDDLAHVPSAAAAIVGGAGSLRESPQLAFLGAPSPQLLISWIDHSPEGARGQRTDGSLQPIGAQLAFSVGEPVYAMGAAAGNYFAGQPRATPPAPLAVTTAGDALCAYDVVDTLVGVPTPRIHYRTLGLRPRGASCSVAADCADGFCAAGVCCDRPCDGVCQACGANGCVVTPASDARCDAISCATLSTACRTFRDPAAQSCAAFGRCAEPGALADCSSFDDAPDGTACTSAALGGAAGVCSSGECEIAGEMAPAPAVRAARGCAFGGG